MNNYDVRLILGATTDSAADVQKAVLNALIKTSGDTIGLIVDIEVEKMEVLNG